jgi:AcrR family transcriptional regulator
MTPISSEFAQKSHTLRAHASLRYGDAMPDVILTLSPGPNHSSPPHQGFPQPSIAAQAGRPAGRERKTLTRADWIGTALEAMARDGLRAVAVEPLAERLGATKGSFYWHFRDRNALIEAAAAEWERTGTDLPLAQLSAIADPQERHAATVRWLTGSEHNTRIFLVLLWHCDHPAIAPVIERILAKRMAFSMRMRQDGGGSPRDSQQAAIHSYSAWLGLQLLRRAAPGLIPEDGTPEGFFQYAASLSAQLLINPADPQ